MTRCAPSRTILETLMRALRERRTRRHRSVWPTRSRRSACSAGVASKLDELTHRGAQDRERVARGDGPGLIDVAYARRAMEAAHRRRERGQRVAGAQGCIGACVAAARRARESTRYDRAA